ncbi:unnamed protein product [Tetraodon nigroviridis]|uniref:(spotted green pufferfish) hypothetical protein n=1 Tax=Tetraodon nigroviridis TaxID=99883 RepID=Q4RXT4_TETNG|nr:unnamed protein product [Tetraodon nigroviridis]
MQRVCRYRERADGRSARGRARGISATVLNYVHRKSAASQVAFSSYSQKDCKCLQIH